MKKSNPNKALEIIVNAIINGEIKFLFNKEKPQSEYAVEKLLSMLEGLRYENPKQAYEITQKAFRQINKY